MPWINDTPHSANDRTVKKGSAAAKLSAKHKADKKLTPQVPPIEKARKRLRVGEIILFTRPKSWTWERTGGKIPPGVIATLRAHNEITAIDPGLFEGNPGQTWKASQTFLADESR